MKLRRRCKCGCGEITSPGRKYIWGHNSRKHDLSNHKLHSVWDNMKTRCYNSKVKDYQNYGGRGIKVCIKWRDNFKVFYNWAIKNSWKYGLEIDRIDNNDNYHPDNCRFVAQKININNRRLQKMPKTNTSGYVGVYPCKNRYRAYTNSKHLGYFDTAEEAAKAVKDYKKALQQN